MLGRHSKQLHQPTQVYMANAHSKNRINNENKAVNWVDDTFYCTKKSLFNSSQEAFLFCGNTGQ